MRRSKASTLFAAALAIAASAGSARAQAPDEETILQTVDDFFLALAAGDADALEALFAPQSLTVRLAPESDAPPRYGSGADIVAAFRDGTGTPVIEPYWEPTVLQRGPLAMVWAPYEVSAGGALIHCGVDLFVLSRHETAWKIDAVSYTAEPSACDELRPADRSSYRPKFPEGENP